MAKKIILKPEVAFMAIHWQPLFSLWPSSTVDTGLRKGFEPWEATPKQGPLSHDFPTELQF